MTSNTPVYDFPYLDGTDGGKQIKAVSKALAQRLEAVLANEGQVPLDADLVALLQRVAALEAGSDLTDTGWTTVTALGTGWTANPGQAPRVRRWGKLVMLDGALVLGSGAQYANLLTVPAGFRPDRRMPLGPIAASIVGVTAAISVETTGLVFGQYNGGAPANGMILPLSFSWFVA
ncbi:hypothetical protein [Streptomyces sp. AC495_CC817]|uniref:hypothetical protein n=1 Tax=Streptomyces sp. AC495_CC817 TaxID=2823900 RepID=UPI001C28138E|nr:hypothetical protein [Streptomyces sp. AC495_CC817]